MIISRRMRWTGHVAWERSAYEDLIGKPDGERPLRKPRSKWQNNIKVDLNGMGRVAVDWIRMDQGSDRW
jgi:hypothetical protein